MHVVSEVVKRQFFGCHHRDVAAIRLRALSRGGGSHHAAHRQAQRRAKRLQGGAVALHQIVVGGEQMHPLRPECGHGGGQRGRHGFAFAGGHFCKATLQYQPRRAVLSGVRLQAVGAGHHRACQRHRLACGGGALGLC